MVTTQYVYQQSIVVESGTIETRVSNGAQLNHKGDSITYRGMPPMQNYPDTYGTILRITHAYESGAIGKLPEDYVLELKPGQTAKVINLQTSEIDYNVIIRAEGPLYEGGIYQGYQVEEAPVEDGISDEADVVRPPRFPFLARFPRLAAFMGGR